MRGGPVIGVIEVQTRGPGLTEITDRLPSVSGEGLLTLLVRHTSCSLLIQENADAQVQADLQNWLHRFVPPSDDPSLSYLTHTYEGPDDMPAHIKAALLPVSLSIPVADGRPLLGTWQGVYLWEHRTRGRRREVAWHFLQGQGAGRPGGA